MVAKDRRHRTESGSVLCEKCHKGKKKRDECAPGRETVNSAGEISYNANWDRKRPREGSGSSPKMKKKARSTGSLQIAAQDKSTGSRGVGTCFFSAVVMPYAYSCSTYSHPTRPQAQLNDWR